jgi:hypothetical protein
MTPPAAIDRFAAALGVLAAAPQRAERAEVAV